MWSYFQHLSHEEQRIFFYDKQEWKTYKISHKETANSGKLDLQSILHISQELLGKEVYIVHNHPTQTSEPSNPDHFQYQYIESILLLHGISVADYLIVSKYGYYSFKEAGHLTNHSPAPFHKTEKEKVISIPNLSMADTIQTYTSQIIQLSNTYAEMIFHPNIQYGVSSSFTPEFFLEKEKQLVYQNIYFQKKERNDVAQLERLRYIDKIIDPIEIYWITEDKVQPLKIEGIL